MIRLYVFVEGGTELDFVKHCLAPHLDPFSVWATPIEVTTKRDPKTGAKLARGGGRWSHWHRDIVKVLRSQPGADVRVTSMFDLYGLPDDFPQIATHRSVPDTVRRVELLQSAMEQAVGDPRFIPYLQRHEFEALVLCGLEQLQQLLDDPTARAGVDTLRQELGATSPEDVNDGPETAPSKRLLARVPGYRKTTHGPLVAGAVGVEALKVRCPRFGAWMNKLEALAGMRP